MSSTQTSTKRIAINSIVLYIRMIVVMLIALYTSRVVLKALGVDDYGLYNVVGGVVSLFAFLRTSMEQATQRFLNFEMGKGDGNLNNVFCVSLTIHILIALVCLILTETVGLWFLNTYINIPLDREMAANVVYQCVILSLCTTIITVPYSASVISHEQMTFYAIVNIADAVLKLGIAIVALNSGTDTDRLILYGVLMMLVSVLNILMYYVFCRMRYRETQFHFLFDKALFRQVFGFTSWTIVGQAATLGTNQGNNILLNMFHSVTANAAMGVGNQVGSAILSLSGNFQTAFNPQMTKSYAAKDYSYLRFLLVAVSKLSFVLMLVVSLPIIFNIDIVLDTWLDVVPLGAGAFGILWIVQAIINSLSTPLYFCINASGNIKRTQLTSSCVYLSDLIVLFALFKVGLPPITAMWVKVSVVMVVLFVRLYFASKCVPGLSFRVYIKEVILPLALTVVLCVAFSVAAMSIAETSTKKWVATFTIIIISLLTTFFVALHKEEREILTKTVKNILHKNS